MAKAPRPYSPKDEAQLMTELWDPKIADDPLAFVLFAFPWGQPGTPLEHRTGPRKWQTDELARMRDHLAENKRLISQGKDPKVYKSATVSGRGSGKSTLVAWITLWQLSCHLGSTTIVTANTEEQLKTKTWAELGKWHAMAINSHWFDKQALSLKPQAWFEEDLKRDLKIDTTYYYAAAQLWSEDNPDAFAGAHNTAGILVIFDEASGIPKPIWTVTSGFFTEKTSYRFWFAFSNGRRNTGAFFECFHKDRASWPNRRHIDSRTVEDVDTAELEAIIRQHGEDSDEARVEVKGMFPRQGAKQFISREIVMDAVAREIVDDAWAPLIMGVDPARYGDDETVICFRQGRNFRVCEPLKLKSLDNMEVANICADLINKMNPDAVCVDAGNGSGIIDRLRELKFRVHEIGFGTKSPDPQWMNNRTYLWAEIREWLKGAAIPNDQDLIDDLTAPEYKFVSGGDVQRLQTKEEMKEKGFASPDYADALACTFGVKVARRDTNARSGRKPRTVKGLDYNPLG